MTQPKLILPNNGVVRSFTDGIRLYFLAGPIRGANDWQAKAIQLLTEKDPRCYIVCPCRYDRGHPLFRYSVNPTYMENESQDEREELTREMTFPNQVLWERYYLEKAARHGSIIFWLPCEDKENPRKKEDGPYARDTYGELGRWSLRSSHYCIGPLSEGTQPEKANLIVGAEKDFPGLSVIQKNFDADHGKPFQFYQTLEDTISAAVQLGKKTNPQPLFNSENA